MKTINRQRRPAKGRAGAPMGTPPWQWLRDALPIPGAGSLALGAAALGMVCAAAEVVQRLTGWSV